MNLRKEVKIPTDPDNPNEQILGKNGTQLISQ